MHFPGIGKGAHFYLRNLFQLIDNGLLQRCVEKSSKTSWECALFGYEYLPWALKEAIYMVWFSHAILIYQNVMLKRRNTCSPKFWSLIHSRIQKRWKHQPTALSTVSYTMDPDTIKSWAHWMEKLSKFWILLPIDTLGWMKIKYILAQQIKWDITKFDAYNCYYTLGSNNILRKLCRRWTAAHNQYSCLSWSLVPIHLYFLGEEVGILLTQPSRLRSNLKNGMMLIIVGTGKKLVNHYAQNIEINKCMSSTECILCYKEIQETQT